MGLSYYHISRDAGGCSDEIAPQDWHAFSKYPKNIFKNIFEKYRIISKSLLFLLETKLAIIKLFSDNNFLQAITEQLKLVFRGDSKLIFKNLKLWTYLWYIQWAHFELCCAQFTSFVVVAIKITIVGCIQCTGISRNINILVSISFSISEKCCTQV